MYREKLDAELQNFISLKHFPFYGAPSRNLLYWAQKSQLSCPLFDIQNDMLKRFLASPKTAGLFNFILKSTCSFISE